MTDKEDTPVATIDIFQNLGSKISHKSPQLSIRTKIALMTAQAAFYNAFDRIGNNPTEKQFSLFDEVYQSERKTESPYLDYTACLIAYRAAFCDSADNDPMYQ